jgi:hypothetical protein
LPLPGHGVQPAAKLGLDQNGNPGTNMFNVSSPNLIGFDQYRHDQPDYDHLRPVGADHQRLHAEL